MLVLVTYDVNVVSASGQRRLRHIAKTCLDFGIRVQNSVFECEVTPEQWVRMRQALESIYEPKTDSLRFYFLGAKGQQKIEHLGAKPSSDVLRDPLIL
jgi:CRISPR-associated protein Cas2